MAGLSGLEKKGYYPSIKKQKYILRKDFNGLPLEYYKKSSENEKDNIIQNTEFKRKPHQRSEERSLSKDHKSELYDLLKKERSRLAREESISPYMVFNNKTLEEMAEKLPTSSEAMLKIFGVGEVKLSKYDVYFLKIINNFIDEIGLNKSCEGKEDKSSA